MVRTKTKRATFANIFGAKAFYGNVNVGRNKPSPRSKPGIFVGYAENRRAYRIVDPEQNGIIETRDVHFLEHAMFSKGMRGINKDKLRESDYDRITSFQTNENVVDSNSDAFVYVEIGKTSIISV